MLPRDRVFAALEFRAPDAVPVEYHASPAGFMEHGENLRRLWMETPDDFGPPDRFPVPAIAPGPREWRDRWGVRWREQSFGAGGLPIERPLDDWRGWTTFSTPPLPDHCAPGFAEERARAARHRERYFLKSGWISIFELMHALRRFEDVLMDIAVDSPEIHRLADRLTEYHLSFIDRLLLRGVDAIQFGDDFGTQSGLILSPKLWRRFFRPRYRIMVKKIRNAGVKVFFHCCGNAMGLLEDIGDLGVDAIWPQLNVYDLPTLARFCRSSKVAVALHPDRGGLMTCASAEAVRRNIMMLAEVFDVDRGGAWFYVEVDRGFPYENVAALTRTIAALRNGAA